VNAGGRGAAVPASRGWGRWSVHREFSCSNPGPSGAHPLVARLANKALSG